MEQREMTAPQPPPRLQFGLKTILAITVVFAALFASGAWLGPAGYVLFLLLAALLAMIAIPGWRRLEYFAIYFLSLIFMACMMLPAVRSTREAPRRSACANNLKQIGLGLQNYHDVYKCFPPAWTTDENGRPMHSWRVLILPFIEQRELYERYDLNEPWDGSHNSLLAKDMPSVFRCPSDKANPEMITDYVAIVGSETIWQPDQCTTLDEIKDGSSKALPFLRGCQKTEK